MNKDLYIQKIDKSVGIKIALEKHYAHACNRAVELCLGVYQKGDDNNFFEMTDDKLLGVAIYNVAMGINTHKSISPLITSQKEMLELVRLWIDDCLGKNTESWVISQSIKYIEKNRPEIKVLLSYSDVGVGHKGGIYQATNWIYQGLFGESNKMYSLDGGKTWKHDKALFNSTGLSNHTELVKILPKPFLMKIGTPKHRYIYLLGNKIQKKQLLKTLKYPPLKYPKECGEYKEKIIEYKSDEDDFNF